MPAPVTAVPVKEAWWQNPTVKFFLICFLTLLMCIPLFIVGALVWERKDRYEKTQTAISKDWGQAQGIVGPVLFVPFQSAPKKPQEYAILLPNTLQVKGQVRPDIRHRGIFQSVVYTCTLDLVAQFSPHKSLSDEVGSMANARWSEATLGIGLSDPKGLLSGTHIMQNNQPLTTLQPATSFNGIQTAINATGMNQGKPLLIKLALHLNGSRALGLAPVGQQTVVTLSGQHGDPSFNGEYLPVSRTVSQNQFTAKWDVSHLARRFPQLWRQSGINLPTLDLQGLVGSVHDDASSRYYSPSPSGDVTERLRTSGFGVTLMEPVDAYKQTERSLKYGIMFLALTFLTYFLFEQLTKAKIHTLQYVMVGLALSLFYLIVLSVSELIGFGLAYAIGTVATVGLISYYSAGFIPKRRQWIMPSVLTAIYAYLYSLLQLEDFSLLVGTIGLFAILAVLMIVTRHIHKPDALKPEPLSLQP
jgi:inner membrane protein